MSQSTNNALATLPVFSHRTEIVNAVRGNRITLVTGETGSGKTTGLAHLLLDANFKHIIITQPRITAATSVAEYVAQARGEAVGQTIGYHSSLYRETSPQTRVVFRTDGLQLAREASGNGIPDDENCVLIIDEHHERSINIDALLALALERLRKGAKFRLVIMSATAEVDRLEAFLIPLFGKVPHVHIEGRTFPVTFEQRTASDLVPTVVKQMKKGRNVLVFLPGIREIENVCKALSQSGVNAEIIPFYADLSKAEKDLAFARYSLPKVVVATNVAQTSITIPDIDAVVDSGLERVPTLDARGVPGLALADTSKADCKQRMGRAGRTKPGQYFLCGGLLENRPDHPLPEINSNRLDSMVLRLMAYGATPESLLFMDAPNKAHLKLARTRLLQLGATAKNGKTLTNVGKQMFGYPLDVEYARMMVESKNRDVLPNMLGIIACASVGGILNTRGGSQYSKPSQCDSDLIYQNEVFLDLCMMISVQNLTGTAMDDLLLESDIVPRRFQRAKDVYHKLCELENVQPFGKSRAISKHKDTIAAIAAGLWPWGVWLGNGRQARGRNGDNRMISKTSAVQPVEELVIGEPFNLETTGGESLDLLQNLTIVSLQVLKQLVPADVLDGLLPNKNGRAKSNKPQQEQQKPQRKRKRKDKIPHRPRNGRKPKDAELHPRQTH